MALDRITICAIARTRAAMARERAADVAAIKAWYASELRALQDELDALRREVVIDRARLRRLTMPEEGNRDDATVH
jgi:ribosomal protein L19E